MEINFEFFNETFIGVAVLEEIKDMVCKMVVEEQIVITELEAEAIALNVDRKVVELIVKQQNISWEIVFELIEDELSGFEKLIKRVYN